MVKKRYIVISVLLALAVIGAVLFSIFAQYKNYEVVSEIKSENANGTRYVKAFNALFFYNQDGASLIDYSGNSKWNISFEMQFPQIQKERDYILLYDKQGSTVEIVDEKGEKTRIKTSYPISMASLSENGQVAVVMQQQEVANIVVYDSGGNITVDGAIHGNKGGYPMAISLSSDGEQLAVSLLHLSEGKLETELCFYDFSNDENIGESSKGVKYSMDEEVIPVLSHVSEDKLLAIGTSHAIIFSNEKEPGILKEFDFEHSVKSVINNDNYFGIISEEEVDNGKIKNILGLYNLNGRLQFSREINDGYDKCELLENNEVLIGDEKTASLYTVHGIEKFHGKFESDFQDLIFAGSNLEYYLLENDNFSKIRLK